LIIAFLTKDKLHLPSVEQELRTHLERFCPPRYLVGFVVLIPLAFYLVFRRQMFVFLPIFV